MWRDRKTECQYIWHLILEKSKSTENSNFTELTSDLSTWQGFSSELTRRTSFHFLLESMNHPCHISSPRVKLAEVKCDEQTNFRSLLRSTYAWFPNMYWNYIHVFRSGIHIKRKRHIYGHYLHHCQPCCDNPSIWSLIYLDSTCGSPGAWNRFSLWKTSPNEPNVRKYSLLGCIRNRWMNQIDTQDYLLESPESFRIEKRWNYGHCRKFSLSTSIDISSMDEVPLLNCISRQIDCFSKVSSSSQAVLSPERCLVNCERHSTFPIHFKCIFFMNKGAHVDESFVCEYVVSVRRRLPRDFYCPTFLYSFKLWSQFIATA